jgi:hypothetical protein
MRFVAPSKNDGAWSPRTVSRVEESHWREDSVFDRDERRFTVRLRRSMGRMAEPGNSEVAADLHDYHRPTQRVGRGNTHSNACYSATGNPRPVADRRSRKGDFATVPSRSHENKSKTGNKPENNDPGLLEEGEMEQVGRLI